MRCILLLICALSLGCGAIFAADIETAVSNAHHIVAIENVCAWPNLTLMPDGTVIAIIHNQPSHGSKEGEVDCWASRTGEKWEKRGTPAPHDPNTVRMNHAAGLTKNGDLIVLCSGWTNEKQPQRPKQASFRDAVLRSWVCRSSDGGKTWSQNKNFPAPEPGWSEYIPFGPICLAGDGSLRASCYQGKFADETLSTKKLWYASWNFRSDDDGTTWKPVSIIGPRHTETSLLFAGGKRWLAVARYGDVGVDLLASDDDGLTWTKPQRVTGTSELNGHLCCLKDGRLLLSYGNRVKDKCGVMVKFSSDEGKTCGQPIRLAHSLSADCGYPSSVQRADGKIVTAYYSRKNEQCDHYHMGVVIWDAPSPSESTRR